jgi:hypothetical protein
MDEFVGTLLETNIDMAPYGDLTTECKFGNRRDVEMKFR